MPGVVLLEGMLLDRGAGDLAGSPPRAGPGRVLRPSPSGARVTVFSSEGSVVAHHRQHKVPATRLPAGRDHRRYNPCMRPTIALLFAATLFAATLYAATVPTIDESLSMKSVSGPQISPDGRYVAYHVASTNWDENEFVTQIWIASTVTGERYQLTSGKKSATGPQWAPDSKHLAFVSDRDGKRQIYLISPAGG